ncbi:heavy metal-associated isoprenylated plant protein 16-like [Pyrus communis]|uniref:heavy metal-associated isoprenylated plant protein 16-like n=1 Tax=Pyrus communis TaxID=23211 RepID=UPI0035C02AEF
MKQKVVIKLSVHDERARAKAMKTAVGVDGVNSASYRYQQDKNQTEVMGEGIDVVLLTTSLRKSLKYAEVVSVPVEEKKKEEKKEEEKEEKEEKKSEPAQLQYVMGCPQYVMAYPSYEEPPNICNIL